MNKQAMQSLLGYAPPPEDFLDLDALGQVTGGTLHLLPARPEVQVFYSEGVARNRGNCYVRVTVECPVLCSVLCPVLSPLLHGARFYNGAKTMDQPVNLETGSPLVWHPGTLHPYETYLDHRQLVEYATQKRADAFQVACLMANTVRSQVKISPGPLVHQVHLLQLGEAAAGLRDSCEDFNVGDLAIHQEDEALVEKLPECGIHGLSVSVAVSGYDDTSENDCWAVDMVRCDYEREERSC